MVEQLAVIGCGLMGGSFALALRKAGAVRRVLGYSRSPASAEAARRLGAIDAVAPSPGHAVRGSDVVLVAVPVGATEATLSALRDELSENALCMDVGSTKQDVVAAAQAALGSRLPRFVPAHPIAGKERAGIAQADAGLYQGCRVILTPQPHTAEDALQRASTLWLAVGARVTHMPAAAHDAAFAAVSHLPHLLAFAYIQALSTQPEAATWLGLAGPGFRDFSRIAAGEPELWRDVLLANRREVLAQSAAFEQALNTLQAAMRDGDAQTLRDLIAQASAIRARWSGPA